ncbi:Uncharacterised protein [Candidatus Anstonella stagnisolia]|nr:Uncharacterised protein [Candidatus Anstonella stagnisolia]
MSWKISFAFALLLLCASASAAWGDDTGFRGQWDPSGRNWQYYALVAVLVCIGFNALVYMLGTAFHLENMTRWAKAEFLQVSASSLMILFVVGMLFGVSGTVEYLQNWVIGQGSTVLCSGKNVNVMDSGGPIEIVKCKLQEHITNLDNMYNDIYKKNLKMEARTATCYILFGMPVSCGDWNMEWHKKVEQAHLLGEKIVPLQVALNGQYALATYIANNMLGVFLPLGIILRIFPITRGVGGLLIAIAIGFYFVFPVIFVMQDPTFVKAAGRPSAIMQDPDMCFAGFKGVSILINSIPQSEDDSISMDYNNYGELLAQLTVKIMFYPFVAFALALIFVRAATPLLGGDTGEIMRMIAKLT